MHTVVSRRMHSQQYPHRIRVLSEVPGGNLGHGSGTWEDVFPKGLWANIRYGTGSEAIRAGKVVSSVEVSIRIRFREGITNAMRVQHKGVVYEILAVLPDLLGRSHVDLVCKVTK